MYICRALFKHGYSNGTFSLSILEYCEPEKCLEREDYYLSTENHEYNIAKKSSAPMSGRKHSEETKTKISDFMTGFHSDETKTKISDAQKGKTLSDETKSKISDALIGNTHGFKKGQEKIDGSGRPSQQIEVTDIKNNTTICYDSISEAARVLNINKSRISEYFSNNKQKPYKGQYTFKKVN
jgi:group I intron endonuclease